MTSWTDTPTDATHSWIDVSPEHAAEIAPILEAAIPTDTGGSLHVHEEVYFENGEFYRVLVAMSGPIEPITAESCIQIAKLKPPAPPRAPAPAIPPQKPRWAIQGVVDLMFSVLLTAHSNPAWFAALDRDELAAWAARQLRENGYDTKPAGSSWGVLVDQRQDG